MDDDDDDSYTDDDEEAGSGKEAGWQHRGRLAV
jgi:hypothetical protein